MGVPETIVAAGIGGAATVTAALFQLYTAVRVKGGQSPKKGSLLRSSFTTATLMIASAAGGYVYAEFRQQQALDDARAVQDELRAMRDEINAQLLVLAEATGRLVRDRAGDGRSAADSGAPPLASGPVDGDCDAAGGRGQAPCAAAGPPEPSTPPANGVAL